MSAIVAAILIGVFSSDGAAAERLFAEGNWGEARRAYEAVLAEGVEKGERARLLDRIGVTHLREGAIWEAEARFTESLEIEEKAEVFLHRGQAYYHAGQRLVGAAGAMGAEVRALMNDAIRDLMRCLQRDASSAEAWVFVGLGERYRADPGAEARAYRKALSLEPGRADAALYLAWLVERSGEPGEARELLETVPETDRTQEHYLALGRLAGKLGDYEGQRSDYLEGIRRFPGDERCYYQLWKAIQGAKRFREFERDLVTVRDDHPDAWLPRYYLGFAYVKVKRPRKAIASFEEVAARLPDWQDPRFRIAQIQRVDLGDEETSIPLYLQVLEKEPGHSSALRVVEEIALGRASAGDLPAAWRLYSALCRADPTEVRHTLNLALTAKEMGRSDEALRIYEEAEEGFPFEPQVPNDRGLLLMGLGREKAAIEALREALDRDPDDLNGLENMGAYARLRGRPGEAAVYFRRAYEVVVGQGRDASKFRRYLDLVTREAEEKR